MPWSFGLSLMSWLHTWVCLYNVWFYFYFICIVFVSIFNDWINYSQGLQAIRCPAGLYFDIDKQTCDWKDAVKNCKLKNKERKVKPLLFTDEPLCQDGFLACGDSSCIERGLFCNGEKDCADGSDENSCGKSIFNSSIVFYCIYIDVERLRSINRAFNRTCRITTPYKDILPPWDVMIFTITVAFSFYIVDSIDTLYIGSYRKRLKFIDIRIHLRIWISMIQHVGSVND